MKRVVTNINWLFLFFRFVSATLHQEELWNNRAFSQCTNKVNSIIKSMLALFVHFFFWFVKLNLSFCSPGVFWSVRLNTQVRVQLWILMNLLQWKGKSVENIVTSQAGVVCNGKPYSIPGETQDDESLSSCGKQRLCLSNWFWNLFKSLIPVSGSCIYGAQSIIVSEPGVGSYTQYIFAALVACENVNGGMLVPFWILWCLN